MEALASASYLGLDDALDARDGRQDLEGACLCFGERLFKLAKLVLHSALRRGPRATLEKEHGGRWVGSGSFFYGERIQVKKAAGAPALFCHAHVLSLSLFPSLFSQPTPTPTSSPPFQTPSSPLPRGTKAYHGSPLRLPHGWRRHRGRQRRLQLREALKGAQVPGVDAVAIAMAVARAAALARHGRKGGRGWIGVLAHNVPTLHAAFDLATLARQFAQALDALALCPCQKAVEFGVTLLIHAVQPLAAGKKWGKKKMRTGPWALGLRAERSCVRVGRGWRPGLAFWPLGRLAAWPLEIALPLRRIPPLATLVPYSCSVCFCSCRSATSCFSIKRRSSCTR